MQLAESRESHLAERLFSAISLGHPIIGSTTWRPEQWTMPKFRRTEPISGTTFMVTYAEDEPNREVDTQVVSPTLVAALAEDSLFGSGAVEIRLTKLLGSGNVRSC
jgi:hypothetical protein